MPRIIKQSSFYELIIDNYYANGICISQKNNTNEVKELMIEKAAILDLIKKLENVLKVMSQKSGKYCRKNKTYTLLITKGYDI